MIPSLVLISKGSGILGSATPWAGKMVKPDFVFHFSESLIVVLEADDDDGHSNSKGNNISRYGTPWGYDRDLIAEIAKMKSCAKALNKTYQKSLLYVRCNSDNISKRHQNPLDA